MGNWPILRANGCWLYGEAGVSPGYKDRMGLKYLPLPCWGTTGQMSFRGLVYGSMMTAKSSSNTDEVTDTRRLV